MHDATVVHWARHVSRARVPCMKHRGTSQSSLGGTVTCGSERHASRMDKPVNQEDIYDSTCERMMCNTRVNLRWNALLPNNAAHYPAIL